jgi:pilus assembly protein CpaF
VIPEIFGPRLAGLIASPGVTDVLVNGHEQVWLQRGRGHLELVPSPFESEDELGQLAQGLIAGGGRHLDQANPFADVSVAGKFRVHASIASACHPKTLISVRIHLDRHFGLAELRDSGMFGEPEFEVLRGIIARRENYLIAGAAGSGKTTLLRAMLAECRGERVIALEDVAEIGLETGHFISLQTRQANIEGSGEITLERLVREALRMRPDRIAVGEVRGAELMVMLQALNTGHAGAGATIHANSFESVSERIGAIGRQAGFATDDVVAQAKSAIHWVIFLERGLEGRRVTALGQFQ